MHNLSFSFHFCFLCDITARIFLIHAKVKNNEWATNTHIPIFKNIPTIQKKYSNNSKPEIKKFEQICTKVRQTQSIDWMWPSHTCNISTQSYQTKMSIIRQTQHIIGWVSKIWSSYICALVDGEKENRYRWMTYDILVPCPHLHTLAVSGIWYKQRFPHFLIE